MNKLAIIIPAYKADYLGETLESIVSHSCILFMVFFGDVYSLDIVYDIV